RSRAIVRATARQTRAASRPRAGAAGSNRSRARSGQPRRHHSPPGTEKSLVRARLTSRLLAGKLKAMAERPERADFRPNDTAELRERWKAYIQDRRLNTTAQREAIVEQFLRTRDHVSIDELLTKVRKRQP